MKKRILILMMSVLLLSSCGKTEPPTEQPGEALSSSQSAGPLTQEITEYKTENLPLSLSGSERLLAILEQKADDSTRLVTLNVADGQVMAQRDMEYPYQELLVFSQGTAVWNWEPGILQVYSDTLEPLWSMELGPEGTGQLYGDDLFYLTEKTGEVRKISLLDQSVRTCQCAEGIYPLDILLNRDGRSLLRSMVVDTGDFIYYWADWEAGALEPVTLPTQNIRVSKNFYYEFYAGDEGALLRSPVSDDVYEIDEKIDWIIQTDPDYLLGESGGNMLIFRDLKTHRCARRRTAGVTDALRCGNAVAYTEADRPQVITIWTPPSEQWSENASQRLTVQDISRENREMIQNITARTDIPVFCGAEGVSYEMAEQDGYHSDPVTDELLIHVGLEQLDRFTRECPEGFFREMSTKDISPIEIYFTGTIWGNLYGAQPGAFTTYTGAAQILVLNISNISNVDLFRATIAHEFLHVMEDRVLNYRLETGLNCRSYWMSFVPDPDLYHYNYRDYQDYDKHPEDYTVSGTQTPLFLDAYSRTMPTEDRARMFEHLYLGEKSEFCSQLRTGVLRQKAEYLCAVIRECFPSCQIQGRLPWENGIDLVPFSEFEDAVRSYVPIGVG